MPPPREWNSTASAALAAAVLALPLIFGSALTAMDAAAVAVLAWAVLGRALGVTWSDVWKMGKDYVERPSPLNNPSSVRSTASQDDTLKFLFKVAQCAEYARSSSSGTLTGCRERTTDVSRTTSTASTTPRKDSASFLGRSRTTWRGPGGTRNWSKVGDSRNLENRATFGRIN